MSDVTRFTNPSMESMDSTDPHNSLFGESIEEDEIELSAAEVISQLETAWVNERFAPSLLESKFELVTCLLEQINSMAEKLEKVAVLLKKKSGTNTSSLDAEQLRVELHQLELRRIRYLIASYLRIRLNKIESSVFYVLKETGSTNFSSDDLCGKMSPEEHQFALKFAELCRSQLKSQVLDKLPTGIRQLEEDTVLSREPNLNNYVFLKVNHTQNKVLIDENDPDGAIDLLEGTQYLVKFKLIAPLVESGALSLI